MVRAGTGNGRLIGQRRRIPESGRRKNARDLDCHPRHRGLNLGDSAAVRARARPRRVSCDQRAARGGVSLGEMEDAVRVMPIAATRSRPLWPASPIRRAVTVLSILVTIGCASARAGLPAAAPALDTAVRQDDAWYRS